MTIHFEQIVHFGHFERPVSAQPNSNSFFRSILSEDMAKKIADLSSDEDDGDNDKITMMNLVKEYLVPKEETYIVPHVTKSKFETTVSKHITGKKLFERYKKYIPTCILPLVITLYT